MKITNALKTLDPEKKMRISLAFSMTVNGLTFVGKVILSILTLSGFLGVSALVTFLSLMTKLTAYLHSSGKGGLEERKTFGLMALTISFGAICYLAYMARLFFFPEVETYDIYEGIAIAAFAFADLGWAIRNLIKEKKKKNLVMIGLKCGSLSNGLSALVLAQIAILAFTNPGVDFSFDNAIGGMVFGGADLLIGLTMVWLYFQTKKNPTSSEKSD
jgi:hypothetical protein